MNVYCQNLYLFLFFGNMDKPDSLRKKRVSYTQTNCPVQFSRSVVSDSATPWNAAHQASLSIINSQSALKLMSIEPVMPSSHLILCRPLLLPPSVFPSSSLSQ